MHPAIPAASRAHVQTARPHASTRLARPEPGSAPPAWQERQQVVGRRARSAPSRCRSGSLSRPLTVAATTGRSTGTGPAVAVRIKPIAGWMLTQRRVASPADSSRIDRADRGSRIPTPRPHRTPLAFAGGADQTAADDHAVGAGRGRGRGLLGGRDPEPDRHRHARVQRGGARDARAASPSVDARRARRSSRSARPCRGSRERRAADPRQPLIGRGRGDQRHEREPALVARAERRPPPPRAAGPARSARSRRPRRSASAKRSRPAGEDQVGVAHDHHRHARGDRPRRPRARRGRVAPARERRRRRRRGSPGRRRADRRTGRRARPGRRRPSTYAMPISTRRRRGRGSRPSGRASARRGGRRRAPPRTPRRSARSRLIRRRARDAPSARRAPRPDPCPTVRRGRRIELAGSGLASVQASACALSSAGMMPSSSGHLRERLKRLYRRCIRHVAGSASDPGATRARGRCRDSRDLPRSSAPRGSGRPRPA